MQLKIRHEISRCNFLSKRKDALAGKHLVCHLDTRKRVMIQDGLYSRFAKHVETVCLENPRRFQKVAPHVRGKDRPDTLFPHEGNVLCRD